MKNKYIVFVLLSLSILISACKSRQFLSDANNSKMIVSEEELLKQALLSKIPSSNFDFNFLQAKAKVQANVKSKDYSLNFNVRMQKDEKIWISVNAIGSIEVARILITKDSVRIIDRINNQYLVKDFDFLSAMLNTDVDFTMIQNLMLGNAPVFANNESLILKQDDQNYQLSSKLAEILINYSFRKEDTKLSAFILEEDTELKRNIRVNYSDYRLVENNNFPFLINSIASSQKESLKLNVQYTKVEKLNNLEFPFNVPKRFE
jgi:hypothetical protein